MKCRFCNATEMEVVHNGEFMRMKPIRDHTDLYHHKRDKHGPEMETRRMELLEKKQVRDKEERQERETRKQIMIDASRVVISPQWGYNQYRRLTGPDVVPEKGYKLSNTAGMGMTDMHTTDEEKFWRARYPEPEIFDSYNAQLEHIAQLQAEADATLARAFQAGSRVSDRDIDAVIAVGE